MKLRWLAIMACLMLMTACTNSKPAPDATGATGGDKSGSITEDPANIPVGLEVGNLAPEIEGNDLDGVAFKLSDYRGKVVFLDFWGDW